MQIMKYLEAIGISINCPVIVFVLVFFFSTNLLCNAWNQYGQEQKLKHIYKSSKDLKNNTKKVELKPQKCGHI